MIRGESKIIHDACRFIHISLLNLLEDRTLHNCLSILIIMMFIKTSYDFLDLEYMGVDSKISV